MDGGDSDGDLLAEFGDQLKNESAIDERQQIVDEEGQGVVQLIDEDQTTTSTTTATDTSAGDADAQVTSIASGIVPRHDLTRHVLEETLGEHEEGRDGGDEELIDVGEKRYIFRGIR